ncbi:uncharacterized protein I206_106829 [Kwoniella pini CBS 10737]|uniref:Uncharacterized protein n=1 Tax=Kwoniella pini CBS 10737 TaxID=1296096 RepID=A0A1B9I011_9TREE|nr:uncharacterized protein I206_05626 [Kwoniella pini CBS 10737]OCF48845.1 hypothetical protein I206_05626 [Kwoniella pini CBS 10737]
MSEMHRSRSKDGSIRSDQQGWDLDMDIVDERNVEDSLPSTPIEGPSKNRKYAAFVSPDNQDEHSEQDDIKYSTPEPIEGERPHPEIPLDEDHNDDTHTEEHHIKDDDTSDKTCRICFSGPEEEVAMGRMISPCLCAGSMRYVHVKCLNAWRGTGTNAKAHLECPQCHYRYQLRRTLISGLATSRPILLLSTGLAFFTLTLTLGQILHFGLHHSPTISRLLLSRQSRTSSMFDFFDDPFTGINEGPIIIVGGGIGVGGGGGSLIWDIFIYAIQTFLEISNNFINYKNNYSIFKNNSKINNLIFEIIIRNLLGIAMLGSISFLSLIITLPFFGPIQILNNLRGFGFLGRRFSRRINNNNNNNSIGSIMIIILVLIGVINTLIQFYNLVSKLTFKLLLYVETQILEVNSEEIREQRKKKEKEEKEKRKREKWYIRWIKDGQYKRIEGWKEVFVRFSLVIDRWFEILRGGGGGENDHEE